MDRFAALADSNRRRIIELIAANGEMASTDISNEFEISAPAISQHLKVLRKADLVKMEKRAQQRIYSINPQESMNYGNGSIKCEITGMRDSMLWMNS